MIRMTVTRDRLNVVKQQIWKLEEEKKLLERQIREENKELLKEKENRYFYDKDMKCLYKTFTIKPSEPHFLRATEVSFNNTSFAIEKLNMDLYDFDDSLEEISESSFCEIAKCILANHLKVIFDECSIELKGNKDNEK